MTMDPHHDIEDYRDRVRLDEPFLAPEPAPEAEEQRESLVDDLLGYLISERPAAGDLGAGTSPQTYHGKRLMLRALLTVRGPDPLPPWFHEKMDRLLQRETDERGNVEAMELTRVAQAARGSAYGAADRCALWQGDITALRVDAVVNAANSALLGCFQPFHACIDNAIHTAAGPRLREDCHTIIQFQGTSEGTGLAKITRGYNLPARYVLHTVGPIFREERSLQEQEQGLSDCYRSCLELALRVPAIRSVAFCCISTGVFGFPAVPAARVALRTVEDFLNAHPDAFDLLVFNVFSREDFQTYSEVLYE
jgi:O-acetyl-ADP-ribose deacetylase (regulator of RNase III)